MDAITITIDGREWPVNRPTDGQLAGMALLTKGKFSEEKQGELTMETIMALIPENAHADFVSEYLRGNYTIAHLRALIPAIVKAYASEDGTAEIIVDHEEPAPTPRKRAAKKTATKRTAQKRTAPHR